MSRNINVIFPQPSPRILSIAPFSSTITEEMCLHQRLHIGGQATYNIWIPAQIIGWTTDPNIPYSYVGNKQARYKHFHTNW